MKKNNYSELYAEILKLETIEECEKFFDDLCTINELEAMLQRIKAAKMLTTRLRSRQRYCKKRTNG